MRVPRKPRNINERTPPKRMIWEALARTYLWPTESAPTQATNPYQEALDAAAAPARQLRGALYRKDLPLSDLKPGECGLVQRLNGTFCGRLRLLEMGLTPGTHVRMVRAAAFGGPVDIEIRGYQLSLRREEAAAVWLGEDDHSV